MGAFNEDAKRSADFHQPMGKGRKKDYYTRRISFFYINLFIFGCVGSLLLRVGFLQLWQAGGFSCCRAWALGARLQ